MHKKLLIKAFKKAKGEIGTDKVSPRAQHLSDFILEFSKEPYGERILREKFNALNKAGDKNVRLKKHAEEALSNYLGYEKFTDFVNENSDEETVKVNKLKRLLNYKTAILLGVIVIISAFTYNSTTKQRWMVWKDNHYIEVDFDIKAYELNKLKLYKEERIKYFYKINANCDTKYFNENGSVKVWYGKNKAKKIECFTALGLHPETGKTLKPITSYMIKKYLCDSY